MMSTENNPAIKSHKNFSQSSTDSRGKASRANCISRDDKNVKGKLNMRSPAGLFIILGLLIVMVGIAIAVVGYWPHKHNSRVSVNQQQTNNSESAVETQRARVRLQSQPVQKNEKLKLIGPLIMGIGLFIFICANTVLHENRDRETKLLAQGNIYSTADQIFNEENNEPERIQHHPTSSSIETSFRCLEQCCAIEEGCSATHGRKCSLTAEKWVDCHKSVKCNVTAQLLHHKRPSPSVSLCSVESDSCNSSEGNLNVPLNCGNDSSVSTSVILPVIKLNNCVIDTPVITAVVEDIELGQPVVMMSTEDLSKLQNHGYIRSGSIRSADDAPSIMDVDHPLQCESFSTRLIGKLLSSGVTRKAYASDMQLHTLCSYSKSFDLGKNADKLSEQKKERQHRSWPRLDCSYIKKYLKLENREDSVDRLLEQIEQDQEKKK
ncbi:transmembrane protein 200A isoform X2 [Pristis pectinata]|uniref:transmembrane protein 200A isoform X2 n=1 Tax=Pristis pectinata TaxID=685728 RepID=UPI00223DDB18|nr:transmembrane protein 200A isoform X2 [Pristis pectinata]